MIDVSDRIVWIRDGVVERLEEKLGIEISEEELEI